MTAQAAHQAILHTLAGHGFPYTVGRTPAAGPIVVVPLPVLERAETGCDPPVGTWTFDLVLVPAGPGARDTVLGWVDTLVPVLGALGEVTGAPTPVGYLDSELDGYTLTLTLED